jgi:hypothetical protein
MNQAKTIVVKLYLDPDSYLAAKGKCAASGLSMSSAGNLAFRQWEPAHHIRRHTRRDRPTAGLKRSLSLPNARENLGTPAFPLRV